MKHDFNRATVERKFLKLLIIPVFLSLSTLLYSQNRAPHDSLQNIPEELILLLKSNIRLSVHNNSSFNSRALISPANKERDRTVIFLDSLRSRASKTLITRKLYDLVIVSDRKVENKTITGESDQVYLSHVGKMIRKITFRRLDVFGSDINDPEVFDQGKLVNLLNSTHVNTNENIIRKNLIFSPGDTVFPLTLSDNERILRQLPYIDDARIIVIPVNDDDVDILVLTKDIFSLGGGLNLSGIKKGSLSLFEKNIFGMGQEFGIDIPWDTEYKDSPGFSAKYLVNNIRKTFVNLHLFYFDGLGEKSFGFDLDRKLLSAATKYAGGISVRQMFTTEDLDTLSQPQPLKYNLQNYWVSRSFLINPVSVSRIILGARYTNNNVFDHPFIYPDSYHSLQKYKMFLGSASFSMQKYYKTNLIYGYGRTEDIPHGLLLNLTAGKEINEFKERVYAGISLSVGESVKSLGYFYTAAGLGTFINGHQTEQGLFQIKTNFFSNLTSIGRYRVRNFLNIDYTRGFDRYSDEYLVPNNENGFSGFWNDSLGGEQRLSFNIESVFFSPREYYGFRYAVFGFADLGYLFGTNQFIGNGEVLSAIGLGIRIRNDNLVFKTFQIRIGFYPNLPLYSRKTNIIISGEQLLRPGNFDPGPPSILPYR